MSCLDLAPEICEPLDPSNDNWYLQHNKRQNNCGILYQKQTIYGRAMTPARTPHRQRMVCLVIMKPLATFKPSDIVVVRDRLPCKYNASDEKCDTLSSPLLIQAVTTFELP